MPVPFNRYGVLQIAFVFILFLNFILSMSYILCENDDSRKYAGKNQQGFQSSSLIMPLMIASTIMLISSCLVFYILVYRARTNDLVGNLRIRKSTASFKVAFLSWILTGMETILRFIGLFHYADDALPEHYHKVPWQAVLCYHLLVLIQRTVQSESQLLIRYIAIMRE